jgi:hypothetical protein
MLATGCTYQQNPSIEKSVTFPKEDVVSDTVEPIQREHDDMIVTDPSLNYLNLPEGFAVQIYVDVPNSRSLEVVETDERLVVFV